METAGRCCAITRALCCPWPRGKEQCPPDTILHVPIPGQQWVVVCQCLGWLLPGFQERLRPGARAALGRQDHRVGLPNSESCRCRFCYTGDTALATPAYVCRIQMDCGASGDVGLTTVLPSGSRGTREAGAAGNTRCSQRGTRRARLGRGVWPRPLCGHQRSLGPGATSKGEKQGRRGPRCCRPGAWHSQCLAGQADETPWAPLHMRQNLEDFGVCSPRSWRLRVARAGLDQLEATEAPGPHEAPSGEARPERRRPGAGSPGQDALTVWMCKVSRVGVLCGCSHTAATSGGPRMGVAPRLP